MRLERGLSQRQVSGPGATYAYVSRIEAGSRKPTTGALAVIAAKLGVSADYLATGEYRDALKTPYADINNIEVHFVGEPDYAFNPMGARGMGEIGITGAAAAVANAVYHATGKRVRDLPITPDKLI